MAGNYCTTTIMCRQLAFVLVSVSSCLCVAEYQQFPGFNDVTTTLSTTAVTTAAATTSAATTSTPATTLTTARKTTTTTEKMNTIEVSITTATQPQLVNFRCPEEEKPSNIGSYEVPTQRDLALHTRKTLRKMFGSYHQKVMDFLDDIKKATAATKQVAKKCKGNQNLYKRCVRHVSTQCQIITKSFKNSIEKMRNDVNAFSQDSVCSISEMNADPVKLIKILAMEEAALEFELPGFLRLLNACSRYCFSSSSNIKRIIRHQVYEDPVIKHFLTRKIYNQVFMNRKYKSLLV